VVEQSTTREQATREAITVRLNAAEHKRTKGMPPNREAKNERMHAGTSIRARGEARLQAKGDFVFQIPPKQTFNALVWRKDISLRHWVELEYYT